MKQESKESREMARKNAKELALSSLARLAFQCPQGGMGSL